jgi:ATP-binding cassette subfamily C (CFTR/MRP) protein 1
VCGLSLLENGRSAAPSTILTVYLAVSGFSDIIKFGLLYVAKNLCSHSILPVAIFMVRMSLLVLEARTKTAILREPFQDLAPEETAGVFGTTFFWWVNKFIALGYSRILSIKDMPPLASNLDTITIREDMQKIWDKRSRSPEVLQMLLMMNTSLIGGYRKA